MSGEENKPPQPPPHDQGYHDHADSIPMQGSWDMHPQAHMSYSYGSMSPSNVSHHPGQPYGGAGHHPHHMMQGGQGQHPMAGQGAGGGGYGSYHPHAMHHSSYPYQHQQSQQPHPSQAQYYGQGGPYYSAQQYHPQYASNSPHPMEGDAESHHMQAYYSSYGGGYMPHPGDPHSSYGMMHPHGGMHPADHPSFHYPHPGMDKTPHRPQEAPRGVSFDQQQQQAPHGSQPPLASAEQRRLDFHSADVKPNVSDDTTTIGSTEAGTASPPGIPHPTSSRSGTLSTTSDKDNTPDSKQEDSSKNQAKASTEQDGGNGNNEKKQTLDTASVLLAFSSTKKQRSASETSMLMDDNASFPTLPTEPSFSSMISEPPAMAVEQSVLPTEYPKRLTTPDDEEKLNALHCYMRSELLEIVVIQPTDVVNKEEAAAKHTPTSTDPQMIGRVGLRCVFCAKSPDGGKAGPSMSIFYPRTISEVYRLVTSWKRCHLSKCRHLPRSVRETLDTFKDCRARGKTAYWVDSAREIGLVDIPTKIGGVRFLTDANGKILNSATSSSTPLSSTLAHHGHGKSESDTPTSARPADDAGVALKEE